MGAAQLRVVQDSALSIIFWHTPDLIDPYEAYEQLT